MRVIDLSQDIHPGMQLFPAYPHPSFILWTKRENYGFEAEVVMMATHTGTHVDAPYHFSPNGVGISEVSLESLMGEAVVLDFSDSQGKELITASQIRAAEKNSATIRGGDIVLLRTGWTRFLGKPEYLSSYPGLSRDAAELFTAIGVKAVGVDSPNPDHPDDSSYPVHNTLLPNNILVIENLTNLSSIKQPRFRFIGLPLKLRGLSGSPIRAIAVEE